MRLPVIVECSARTMIQERFNTEWIEENEVGIVVPGFSRVTGAVKAILSPARHQQFLSRIDRLNNRAVFETVDVLERLMPAAGIRASRESAPANMAAL